MKKRPDLIVPLLAAILLVVSLTSFFHSVHFLANEDHAIKVSLNDFKNEEVGNLLLQWNYSEAAIPNPALVSGYDSFSACLLVMDDNHRLVEWMAYHYHVLPLRYLIIAVDPRSKTSPTSILNRWRRKGMYIEEWSDYQIFKPELARNKVSDHDTLQIKRDRHRARQKNFYRLCLKKLALSNRTYTMLIDTDEFLVYNHAGRDKFEEWEREQQRIHDESRFSEYKRIRPSKAPPTTAESGAMINYIRQEKAAGHPFFQSSCISCPRSQFGAKESSMEERQAQVPDGIDADRFDTLRFRKHVYRNDFVRNGLSKSIIDVSQLDPEKIPRIMSLHRPIKTICSAPWKNEWESGLRINHYLGSWEGKMCGTILSFVGRDTSEPRTYSIIFDVFYLHSIVGVRLISLTLT